MKRLLFILLSALAAAACIEVPVDTFGNIGGTVSDKSSGNPLSGVSVVLTPTGYSQVTNSEGVFQFDNLDVQEYTLTFSRAGYEAYQRKVTVKPGLSSIVEISLKVADITTGIIEGKVTDKSSGNPLSGVSVVLAPTGYSQITNSEGVFQFGNLDAQEYTLTFSRADYETYQHKVTVKPGQTSSVQVNLKASEVTTGNISGTVADESSGNPLSGVSVVLAPTGYSQVTSSEGVFQFGNLDAQDYTLTFSRAGYDTYKHNVTVKPGQTSIVQVSLKVSSVTLPTITIGNATNLTANSVRLHATLTSIGSSAVTHHGFCYAEHSEPTTADQCINLGAMTSAGQFSQDITGLSPSTTYYFRAYAQNGGGLVYSDELVLSTPDSGGGEGGGIVVTSGLMLFFSFDSEEVKDETDNDFEAIAIGSPQFLSDSPNGSGKSLFLNGAKGQYITIPYALFDGLQSYSIAFWAKDFSTGSFVSGISVYGSDHPADNRPKVFLSSDGKLIFDTCGRSVVNNQTPAFNYPFVNLQAGEWHHIAVTFNIAGYNDARKYLYVDGTYVDTLNDYTTNGATTKVQIGGNGDGGYTVSMTTKIDNIRFYSRTLTKEEVKEIYQSEK